MHQPSKCGPTLVAYTRPLNKYFPRQDLTRLCGFFSAEREFARHIKTIEARIKVNPRA